MTIETPLFMQDATVEYTAKQVRRSLIAELFDEGVLDLSAFVVTERAAGANFTVDVTGGGAVVTGDDEADQGNYIVRADADTTDVEVTAAPGSNSRYDIVVLRVNDPQAGGPAGFDATLEVVAGTPAGSPTVPATPTSAIRLAIIGPITSATASITDSIITDTRLLAGRRCTPGTLEATVNSRVPNGWLLAAGQSLLRSDYPALFAHIGTTHGAVDGTHFTLPDLRGRVPVGLDNMNGSDAGRLDAANVLGGTGGAQTVTLTEAQMPVHDHGVTDPEHSHVIEDPEHDHPGDPGAYLRLGSDGGLNTLAGDGAIAVTTDSPQVGSAATGVTTQGSPTYLTVNNAGSGDAHNNMQPYILVNYLIRI